MVQLVSSFGPPVNVHDHIVTVRSCLPDHFQEFCDIETPEHARGCLRRPFRIRRIQPFDLCRGDERKFLPVCDKRNRSDRFLEVSPGSDIRHSDGLQRIERVRQGHLPVIIRVVVRERHKICAHVKQPGRILRIRPEGKLFSGRRRPAVRVRELVVYHKNICVPHDGEKIRGDPAFDSLSAL